MRHDGFEIDRCAACACPITNVSVSVEGKHYHQTCFKCSMCHQPIRDAYGSVGGQVRCASCMPSGGPVPAAIGTCAKCKRPIEGRAIQAMGGRTFHPECFRCAECGAEFQGTFHRKNDEAVCTDCHRGTKRVPQENLTPAYTPSAPPSQPTGYKKRYTIEDLEKLAGMRDRGVITEEEFVKLKRQILADF